MYSAKHRANIEALPRRRESDQRGFEFQQLFFTEMTWSNDPIFFWPDSARHCLFKKEMVAAEYIDFIVNNVASTDLPT